MFNSWRALSYFLSGISNVAFFFSAICTQEKKKGSIQESEDESDSSDEEFESSQVPSSTSQQWLDGNLASVNKALCPAISYWVALTTPNGAPASPISVHKALLNCGVDVIVDQVKHIVLYANCLFMSVHIMAFTRNKSSTYQWSIKQITVLR